MGQIYQAERKLEELALEESLKRDLLEIEMRSEQKARRPADAGKRPFFLTRAVLTEAGVQ